MPALQTGSQRAVRSQRIARRQPDAPPAAPARPQRSPADAFLTHRFSLKISPPEPVKTADYHQPDVLTNYGPVQEGIRTALLNMAGAYGWNDTAVGRMREAFDTTPYPLNVLTGVEWANRMIDDPAVALLITTDDCFDRGDWNYQEDARLQSVTTASLSTVRTLNTGPTLYFLPLDGVIDALPDQRPLSNLFRAVLSYLVAGVGIPHAGDESSFLWYQMDGCFEMIAEDLADKPKKVNKQEWAEHVAELRIRRQQLRLERKQMKRSYTRLNNPRWAAKLAYHFERFNPATEPQSRLKETIAPLVVLQRDFPDYRLSSQCDVIDKLDRDEIGPIAIEEYVGLIYSYESVMTDAVSEFMDCQYQEGAVPQEPTSIIRYDTRPGSPHHDLSFSQTLFKSLAGLSEYLNYPG